jgi:hypothetical protein
VPVEPKCSVDTTTSDMPHDVDLAERRRRLLLSMRWPGLAEQEPSVRRVHTPTELSPSENISRTRTRRRFATDTRGAVVDIYDTSGGNAGLSAEIGQEEWDPADSTLPSRFTVIADVDLTERSLDVSPNSSIRTGHFVRVIHAEPYGLLAHALHIVGFPVTILTVAIFVILVALRLDGLMDVSWWVVLIPHFVMWPHYATLNFLARHPRMLLHSGAAFNARVLVDVLYVVVFPVVAACRYEDHLSPAFTSVSWLWLSVPLLIAVVLNCGAGLYERHRDAALKLQATDTTSSTRALASTIDVGLCILQMYLVSFMALYFDAPPSDPSYALASDYSLESLSVFTVTLPLWFAICAVIIFLPRLQVFTRGQFTLSTFAMLLASYLAVVFFFIAPLALFCMKYNNYYAHVHWGGPIQFDGYPFTPAPTRTNGTNSTSAIITAAVTLASNTSSMPTNLTYAPVLIGTRPGISSNGFAEDVPLSLIVAPLVVILVVAHVQAVSNVVNHYQRLMRGMNRRSRAA